MAEKLEERLFAKYGGKENLTEEAQEQIMLRFARNFQSGLFKSKWRKTEIARKLEKMGLASSFDSQDLANEVISTKYGYASFKQIAEKNGETKYMLVVPHGEWRITRAGCMEYCNGFD